MTIYGVDYSWTHPAPEALAAAGKAFAGRYLPWDRAPGSSLGAFLTGAERDALHDAGIAIVALYEREASRASTAGSQGGLLDGTDARSAMSALGFPVGRTVYVTVQDTTTVNEAVIATYFGGFLNGLGPKYRAGIYAGSVVRNYLAAHGFPGVPFWQAAALSWSGYRWDSTAAIQQRGSGTSVPGTDGDRALVADYGQWAAPQLPETDTEADMIVAERPKFEDWMPNGTNGVYRAKPVRSDPVLARVAAGTIVRTECEVTTDDPANSDWRRSRQPVGGTLSTVYLLRSDWTPLVAGGDPAVDAAGETFMARQPFGRPYHIDIDVTSNAAPVATVTQA